MAIQMRRGPLANYDEDKMLPGEWGITTDNDTENQKAFIAFGPGASKEVMMVEDADSVPTQSSNNPITSGGVYDALATKQDVLTFDNAPTNGSSNPVTSDGIYDALATKQDTLTFDNTPTASSNNPVTSDGIKNALDAKQDTLTIDSAMSGSSTNPVQNKVINAAVSDLNNQITDMHLFDRDDSDTEYTITNEVIDGHLVTTYTEVSA